MVVTFFMNRFGHTETIILYRVVVHLLWEINNACIFLFLQMINLKKTIIVLGGDFNPTENRVKIFTHCCVIIVLRLIGLVTSASFL